MGLDYEGHAAQLLAESRWAGKKPWPVYRLGWGQAELHFPLSGVETGALTLLTGLPLSPGSPRSTRAKGQ